MPHARTSWRRHIRLTRLREFAPENAILVWALLYTYLILLDYCE